eukprot:TRINITY_DN1432_c0_g1_i2.p1 TRINITY_DN1432_c0_g1~~TRINITY_DN1432_c0_g1_i2.p1  ORF type:complete len:275 (-),score=26.02 TRINITY_DN1432_c0_g1_i2:361-1185(-)
MTRSRQICTSQENDENFLIRRAMDGNIYPRHFVMVDGDVPYQQYSCFRFDNEYDVERIVDQRIHNKKKQYKVKFAGLELDVKDWYDASHFFGSDVIEQWEMRDKPLLKRIRDYHCHRNTLVKKTPPRQFISSNTSNLDMLATITCMEERRQQLKRRREYEFQELLDEMFVAQNGRAYPKSWLYVEGDILYQMYKDIEYNGDFEVERISDQYVVDGKSTYLVKFVGFELSFTDEMEEKSLNNCKGVFQKWKKSESSLLSRLRDAFNSKRNTKRKI